MSHASVVARRKRILVIDDSIELRRSIRTALRRCGLSVIDGSVCDTGRLISTQVSRFDLVITNKPEWFKLFGAPIIYIASCPDPCTSSQCAGTIQKPFGNDALLSVVSVCLRSSKRYNRPQKSRIIVIRENRIASGRSASPKRTVDGAGRR